jgi:hypothetical protein
MKEEVAGAHLTPEQFVDLLEGSPVEAVVRRHLSTCAECGTELRGLEETLGAVRAESRAPSSFRRHAAWLGAAAAIAAAAVFLYPGAPESEPLGESVELRILAPLGADADYRILEALSGQWVDDETLALPLADFPDASELDSGELRDLAERLAREMSTKS